MVRTRYYRHDECRQLESVKKYDDIRYVNNDDDIDGNSQNFFIYDEYANAWRIKTYFL